MHATRALLLAVLVVTSMAALPLAAAGGLVAPDSTIGSVGDTGPESTADRLESGAVDPSASGAGSTEADAFGRDAVEAHNADAFAQDDRDENPSTEDTIGYVEGYWYDDELPVDDRDDAALTEDELEAVVHRSMARVEVLRQLTFRDEVPVEVVTRAEFQADEELFGDITEEEVLYEDVRLEALFMAERDADALDEWETVYGGSVGGFYQPEADRIVLVSENAYEPEVNEEVLGHELVHALQDQHFDLTSYERDTQDRDTAVDGLVEGDANWVEEAYAERCEAEWSCTTPAEAEPQLPPAFNWGLYFTIFQPYDDGPEYVDSLYEEGGWDRLNAAYDDPPASTSEVIRPGEEREPRSIEVEDRSGDAWEQYEFDGELASDTVGEAAMVAMFADGALEDGEPSVLGVEEFVDTGPLGTVDGFDYDQPSTDGWAGDELVVYVGEDESVEESGYVWRSEWTAAADAEAFLEGYLTLLAIHGAEAVEDRRNTFTIEDGYPGAYAIERDDGNVTIVRAPSVDELSEIDEGVPIEGEDTLAIEGNQGVVLDGDADPDDGNDSDGGSGSDGGNDSDDGTSNDDGTRNDDAATDATDDISGFGVGAAVLGLLLRVISLLSRE